jgi:hypothetical protein
MNKFKKTFRLFVLVFLIGLALAGVSLTGVFPITPNYRERYSDNEIKIELVEEKEDESQEKDFGNRE